MHTLSTYSGLSGAGHPSTPFHTDQIEPKSRRIGEEPPQSGTEEGAFIHASSTLRYARVVRSVPSSINATSVRFPLLI